MSKKKFYGFIHLPLPPELTALYRRKFYGIVPDHIDFIRKVLHEAKDSWNGAVGGLVYNGWKYFVKMGVDEEFYRFYRSLTLAERLEFNRQFVELLKKKLAELGVQV